MHAAVERLERRRGGARRSSPSSRSRTRRRRSRRPCSRRCGTPRELAQRGAHRLGGRGRARGTRRPRPSRCRGCGGRAGAPRRRRSAARRATARRPPSRRISQSGPSPNRIACAPGSSAARVARVHDRDVGRLLVGEDAQLRVAVVAARRRGGRDGRAAKFRNTATSGANATRVLELEARRLADDRRGRVERAGQRR